MPQAPECLECGACCFSRLDVYVPVSGADHGRLADAGEALVAFGCNQAHMRMHEGHCAALVVDHASAQLVCSVYSSRPQACRELARGSAACRGELDAKARRPLIALGHLGPEGVDENGLRWSTREAPKPAA